MVYVLLSEGFEEIEALAVVDILRRAGLQVQTVGVQSNCIRGSHQIEVKADITIEEIKPQFDAIVLPGGPGTGNMEKVSMVQKLLDVAENTDCLIAAICAAPFILGHRHMLDNKKFTCYPGCEAGLDSALYTGNLVEEDGRFITGKGPGAAIPFALKIVSRLVSEEKAKQLSASMQCQNQ